ncbi:unnamed protein product [Sphenostylis stenocarpa]|uniref:Uncharacterized protein n=1 Tax=Sphenostylis stenocarpa TaxID=92480 RepID=A0AA86S992_9FABA|nr:unnamed protein product [Sphenostylis stenocarpa]
MKTGAKPPEVCSTPKGLVDMENFHSSFIVVTNTSMIVLVTFPLLYAVFGCSIDVLISCDPNQVPIPSQYCIEVCFEQVSSPPPPPFDTVIKVLLPIDWASWTGLSALIVLMICPLQSNQRNYVKALYALETLKIEFNAVRKTGADGNSKDYEDGFFKNHCFLQCYIILAAGIVLFLLVEKVVRYVEENSGEANSWTHGHHHHNHNSKKKLKNYNSSSNAKEDRLLDERKDDHLSGDSLNGDNQSQSETSLRKRIGSNVTKSDNLNPSTDGSSTDNIESSKEKSLVFGYLNLFSDGVHNFTDGMALGSAFLLYGSVGGWSRTLFLLAHELPQEIGDFGILIRSGFSVPKALFFNFLSALVALAGTALALLWGKDPGQSSLIEGFTAGGFIYIAIAGVLAEMNNNGNTKLRSTVVQIISLTMGMAVALGISLVE